MLLLGKNLLRLIPQGFAPRRVPFACGVLWLLGEGLAGTLRLDSWHLLLAGLVGAGWLSARQLYLSALLVVLLLSPLIHHFSVLVPLARSALMGEGGYLRVEGTVRGRAGRDLEGKTGSWLLLGEVEIWRGARRFQLAELEVILPGVSHWRFPYRRRVRIGGRTGNGGRRLEGGPWRRPRLDFIEQEHHVRWEPLSFWKGESLRLRLRDRAAYYLDPEPLAVYLPIVLGLRERRQPEARKIAASFRRVGIAHLFAISGLHVGLLYVMFTSVFAGMTRIWLGRWPVYQGWVHGPSALRLSATASIWLYIALIGFPVSAVRAALMVSMLVWNEHWGTRSPPMFILSLAGLGMLAFAPSQLYDLSFQLSFLAYFFLLSALGIYWPGTRAPGKSALWRRWLSRAFNGAKINLWITLSITLGLWPLATATFGQVSLLVFFGNLVMIPPLSMPVLPLGLAGLGSNILFLGASPGGWWERAVFNVLNPVLTGWVGLAKLLDRSGGALVFSFDLNWTSRSYFFYYLALLGLIFLGRRWRSSRVKGLSHPA